MALSRTRRSTTYGEFWPGYVDVLSTLLLVVTFLMSVFMVSQFYVSQEAAGKDTALRRLTRQIAEITNLVPMVKIDKDYVFQGPQRQAEPARSVRRPPPAHRLPLHVRPGVGEGLPGLHRLRRRAGRPVDAARPRHHLRADLARAARRSSRPTRRRRAGTCRGSRRSAATSTTTSTSRSTRRSPRSSTTIRDQGRARGEARSPIR